MAGRGGFNFKDSLSPSLQHLLPVIDAAVDIAFDAEAARAASMLRQNAPWTDRTGNARAGLKAIHESEPMVEHRLVLLHSMPYGIWLEVRWSGRYAVIGPTMPTIARDLVVMLAASIERAINLSKESPI
jgi:hypothetical protein